MSTYHCVQNQGKLMMQSLENSQKLNLGNFLMISRPNISKLQIFWKMGFIQLKVIFSNNFRSKSKKTVTAVFEKDIKVSVLELI